MSNRGVIGDPDHGAEVVTRGDYSIIAESGLFDRAHYLRSNPDVAEALIDPILHFCDYGWREGRDPSPFFSTTYYSRVLELRNESAANPFVHYITKGRAEGLRTREEAIWPAEPVPLIRSGQWKEVRSRALAADVDLIIPVYRGYRDTGACIHSVLSTSNETDFRLVVINDCTPEPRLEKLIETLHRKGLFEYIRNTENLGFTGSVNLGMALNPGAHKVLLNSDTIVYDGWLDRLIAHASDDDSIGTITPLSNNATILSYPDMNTSNNYSLELPFAALDSIASVVNARQRIDIPTGVGFCMYIDRNCLHQVGQFDAETFKKGYGEENDFCRRALSMGWRNVVAADVFVRHTGEVSFALEARAKQRAGQAALLCKHPDYEGHVRRFISRDPVKPARQQIDLGRLLLAVKHKQLVLFISHANGGGIEAHLRELSRELECAGTATLLLTANAARPDQVNLNVFPDQLYLPNLTNLQIDEFLNIILPRLLSAGLKCVHLQSAVGFDLASAFDVIREIRDRGLVTVCTIHDYSPVCPRHHLVDDGEDYCGLASETICNACIASLPGKDGQPREIVEYRDRHRDLLALARSVFVPSEDTRTRLQPYFPNILLEVRRHIEHRGFPKGGRAFKKRSKNEPIRIVTHGAIGPHKGSSVILACSTDAQRRSLPLKFHVVGYTDIDHRLIEAQVDVTGPYRSRQELFEKLQSIAPHIAFFPSIWPETYLYTLSDAMELGIFPVAFDIGAQAERITEAGWGALIDLDERFNPEFINDTFLELYDTFQRSSSVRVRPDVFQDTGNILEYYGYQAAGKWRSSRLP